MGSGGVTFDAGAAGRVGARYRQDCPHLWPWTVLGAMGGVAVVDLATGKPVKNLFRANNLEKNLDTWCDLFYISKFDCVADLRPGTYHEY